MCLTTDAIHTHSDGSLTSETHVCMAVPRSDSSDQITKAKPNENETGEYAKRRNKISIHVDIHPIVHSASPSIYKANQSSILMRFS